MPLPEEAQALIPEDLRDSPTWEKFNSPGDVFKSYAELEKRQGNSIAIPDEKAKPEDAQKWWAETSPKLAARGFIETKPESPDKYEWKFEGVQPEEIANDAVLKKFAPIAHELGLSNRQASALVEKFGKDILPELSPEPQFADAMQVAQKAFGSKAAQEIDNYKKAMAQFAAADPELAEIIKDDRPRMQDGKYIHIIDHPAMIRFVNKIAKMQQDFGGGVGSLPAGVTMETIDTEIADLRANKELSQDEIGKRLNSLYEKKQILINAAKRR
jgi:hypothetical protein